MIIFDLDGTLADCEHRRHFVEREHRLNEKRRLSEISLEAGGFPDPNQWVWKPEWKSFYESCSEDKPIMPTVELLISIWIKMGEEVQIWSGRCESVRGKTERWLSDHIFRFGIEPTNLKMRPIGDNTPDDVLKERWLDETIAQGKTIEYVFDDRPKVVRMWRRRGIFVFNCNQTDQEF